MRLFDYRPVKETLLGEATRWALKNEIKPRLRGRGPLRRVSREFGAAMEIKDGFRNPCRFVVDLTSTAKDMDREQDRSMSLDFD
jgi:hypothetical protein